MSRWMSSVGLAAAVVCVTAVASLAQQTTTSKETKSFEVIAVDGNHLVVRLPEGTQELTVPEDFRFMVNGQPLSVRELKAGHERHRRSHDADDDHAGDCYRGEERHRHEASPRTSSSERKRACKMFSEGDLDKRGVKLLRGGKPAELVGFP